jgi:haloalkane dehalogenase
VNCRNSSYPFQGKRLGLQHYLDEGSGETVLMVHGNPTWSFYFREVVRALAPTHRCIVPDHVGMGLSERPDDSKYEYTLKSRIDDLDALMAHAAPSGPVTLIVHDWGGMIGMGWATRHPERVKAIVALNTSCFRLPEEKPFPGLLRFMRGAMTGIPLRASSAFRKFILSTCTAKTKLSAEAANGYLHPYDGWDAARAVHRFVQDIPLGPGDRAWEAMLEVENRLHLLKDKPMLLPWGMKDWVFDAAFLNGWTKRFPKATVRRFDDCGHFLLEDAKDEVVPLIRDFVAGKVPA